MKIKHFIPALILLPLFLGACKPKTPLLSENTIAVAVAETLASQPVPTIQATYTPYPTIPTFVPVLEGLFCEYQFCIGHPIDIALFDAREAENPSLYGEGGLAAYSPDFFTLIVFFWIEN